MKMNTRSHSVGSDDHKNYHKDNEPSMGFAYKSKPSQYLDPTIKNKIHGAKLAKWKVFVHCDKFIDFQKNIIFEILNNAAKIEHEQPDEEDLEKLEKSKKDAEKKRALIR